MVRRARPICGSYGETVAECSAVKPVCNAIADSLDAGEFTMPGTHADDMRYGRCDAIRRMTCAHEPAVTTGSAAGEPPRQAMGQATGQALGMADGKATGSVTGATTSR
jgi:hypothetical protein